MDFSDEYHTFRVLEVDLNTFDRKDLECPGDVMAVYQYGDRIFATGSVSAQNTKQVSSSLKTSPPTAWGSGL